MRMERKLELRDALYRDYCSLFWHAKLWGWTHDMMLEERRMIWDRRRWQELPQWIQAYCDGAWRVLMDNTYANDLLFGYEVNGQVWTTDTKRLDYWQRSGIDGACLGNGRHYWRETRDRGLMPF